MALRQAVDPFRYRFILLETVTCRVAVSAFFDDDRDSKSPDVNRDTHSAHLLPGGWGQPPAVVQRLHPVKHRVFFYCSREFDKM